MARTRRTLVAIEYDNGAMAARVEEAAQSMRRRTLPLQWTPWTDPLQDNAALATYGGRIRDTLYTHPDVAKALTAVFNAPPGETWTVVFDAAGADAEAIRWEALQNTDAAHVALRLSPRLCRIAADAASPPLGPRAYPRPLKLLAFLSAAGISARDELTNLLATLRDARSHGVIIEGTVFVGEPDLLETDLSAYEGVSCQPIPASPQAIEAELRRAKPDFLHFFCHGASEPSQWLEFATVTDHLAGRSGSALLNMDRLLDCKVLQGVWAVVFNCCDGGRPAAALNSMAYRAVAYGGAPAAIGMGAPLPAAAAAIFSKAFYRGLFAQLESLLEAPGDEPAELDFGEATAQARLQLHQSLQDQAPACTAWSLPIIYLHRDPLQIQLNEVLTPRAEARLRLIGGQLANLPADSPKELRQMIWSLYDQEPVVPPAFRTDLMGAFPSQR